MEFHYKSKEPLLTNVFILTACDHLLSAYVIDLYDIRLTSRLFFFHSLVFFIHCKKYSKKLLYISWTIIATIVLYDVCD